MTDLYRDDGHGAALKYQTTKGTFATPSPASDYLCWLTGPPSYRMEVGVAKPKVQRMDRIKDHYQFDTTRRVVIPLAGIVDSVEQGLILMSALGGDVVAGTGPYTHTFKPGKLTGANPQPLISGEVISGQTADGTTWKAERLKDGRIEDLVWIIDLNNGTIMYTCNLVGAYEPPAYVNLPTLTPSGKPLAVTGVVLSRNSNVIYPVITGNIHFTNTAKPLNGTPASAGAGPVDVWRHSEGDTAVHADLLYYSSADLAASYGDFTSRTNAALSFLATVPGSTDSLSLSLPSVKYDTGEQTASNDEEEHQHVGGDSLYDTGIASNAAVVLTNAKSSVYNS
jgi:hypothetical protein